MGLASYHHNECYFRLIADSGWITDLVFVEVSGKYTASVDIVANKMSLYDAVLRNYGASWASIAVTVEHPFMGYQDFPAPHGSKVLKIYVMVDDLGTHDVLYFDVELDPPAS